MSDSIEAKFQIVQERTLPVIASEIHQIERTVYGVAMDGAIQIGEKLKEAQGMVPAGEWVKWLNENLNYSQRQAYNFMEIASNYGDKNSAFFNLQTSANLSISKALELLKVPEEEVESFAENTDIENASVRELKEEIRKLKAEKEAAEEKAVAADLALNSADAQDLADAQNALEHMKEELERKEENRLAAIEAKDNLTEQLRKAKEKLKAAKAAKDEEVAKAIEEGRADIEKKAKEDALADVEATLGKNAEDISRLEAEVERLEAEAAKLSNTTLMEFKVYVDQLQDIYFRINDLITEERERDEASGIKMQAALQKIVEGWRP